MKGKEMRIMKEFHLLEAELDDMSSNLVRDELKNLVDKICNEKYQLVFKISKELLIVLNKMKDYDTTQVHASEYVENMNRVNQTFREVMNYFNTRTDLENEIREILLTSVIPIHEKIKAFIIASNRYGFPHISEMMKFNYQKHIKEILTVISEDSDKFLKEYKNLICNEMDNIYDEVGSHYDKVLFSLETDKNVEIKKRYFKKFSILKEWISI